ncbi:MAG: efflux RND transporter periplasmic adaptor subunit, partial [Patescibacteria group bacterium]
MKKYIAALLITTALVSGCGKSKITEKKEEKTKTVYVTKVISEDIDKNLRIGGEVDAFDEVNTSSDTGGDIEAVYKINGQWVKKGEPIVKLSNDQIEATFKRAEAAFLASSSSYAKNKKYIEDENKNGLASSEMQYVSAKMK